MNPRNTWIWLLLAGGLFAFIFFFERHLDHQPPAVVRALPNLKAANVQSLQLRLPGQREIRAVHTNGAWQLTQPLAYPAQAARIEALLDALQQLTVTTHISEKELNSRPNGDAEFGIEPPQISLIIHESNYRHQIHIGHRTAPGDHVYMQVVGLGGIYVLNSGWMELLPRSVTDWRETTLVDLTRLPFNRLVVTNAGTVLELQRNPTNHLWRMVLPIKASADSEKVEAALRQLQELRIQKFETDDPQADLEAYSLAPAELSLTFAQDTNTLLSLETGRTNADLVFARRRDLPGVVSVTNAPLAPWRASHETFRNPRLVTVTAPITAVKVHALDRFTVRRQATNSWVIEPEGGAPIPGDAILARELVDNLTEMKVTEFVKDSVPDVELSRYGLATPAREYILKTTVTNSEGALTNIPFAELQFGTNQETKVFARRAGESFVYAVQETDLEILPAISWQMRDRRVWNFSEAAVAAITLSQNGRTRRILHGGTNEWSLAPGSEGVINVGGVEETAYLLGQLSAVAWVTRGNHERESFGFQPDGLQISVELRNGEKLTVELGREAAPGIPYAVATLNDEPWVFAFPPIVFQFVRLYLIPNQP